MQTFNKKPMVLTGILAILCVTLFSFSTFPGEENYKIYVNKKLVVDQYVSNVKKETFLSLNQTNFNDKIDVYYNHCGQSGTARHIVIKDEQNRILKDWRFADASGSSNLMTFNAKDLMALQKGDTKKVQLYYSSKELPGGKLLATVVKGSDSNVAKL